MSLAKRFFLILLAMALLPLSLAAVWQVYNMRVTRYNVFELHRLAAKSNANQLAEWFAALNHRLAFINEMDRPGAGTRARQDRLAKLVNQAVFANSDILSITLLARGGEVLMHVEASGAGERLDPAAFAGHPGVLEARRGGKAGPGDVVLSEGVAVLPVYYPLRDKRVVVLRFSLESVWKRMHEQKFGESGRLLLVDARGEALPGFRDHGLGFSAEDLNAAAKESKGGTLEALHSNVGTLAGAYKKVDGLPWSVVTLQRRAEVLWAEEYAKWGFLAFVLISLIIAVPAAVAVAARISTPVTALLEGAHRVADQNLDTPVEEAGWSEFRDLAKIFNQMMTRLKSFNELQVDKIIEQKSRAETLIKALPGAVLMLDDDNNVAYANGAAHHLLELGQDQASAARFPRGVKRKEFLEPLTRMLLKKQHATEEVGLLLGGDPPVTKFYRAEAIPFSAGGSKTRGKLVVLHDITIEKDVEKAKEDFFHMITHDLRQPLGTIQGYAELLETQVQKTEKTVKYFKFIHMGTAMLGGMIEDILNVTKLERGAFDLELQDLDAREFLESIVAAYGPAADQRKVYLKIGDAAPGIRFKGDSGLLRRLISNLVNNALKFTKQGGITLSCVPDGPDHLRFIVADTGAGVPADKKDKIFEKFGQLERDAHKGFGIGLSMCQMAAKVHGGRIWVESELGKGSEFMFTVHKSPAGKEASPA